MCKGCGGTCGGCAGSAQPFPDSEYGYGAPDLYDQALFVPEAGQDFSWSEFADTVGNTVQSGVGFLGGNLDANVANANAVAQINAATAGAITAEQRRKDIQAQNLYKFGVYAIIAIVVVVIATKIWK